MTRTELLETYLKPTDLTVKELIDRNAFAQIMQFAEAYKLEQLRIGGVVSSLKKICTDLNIDTEEVLLEYDKKLNGFEVLYDEGVEQTFYVRKGFIQL